MTNRPGADSFRADEHREAAIAVGQTDTYRSLRLLLQGMYLA